jgi:hypothetical protein
MKIMCLGIAVWPTYAIAMQKMWIWLRSVKRHGYAFQYYGIGTRQWPGYRAQKVEFQLDYLKREGWGDATHILYTDCCDCLLLAPPGELEAKYKAMGCPPMLVSASHQLSNSSVPDAYPCFETPEHIATNGEYRYPNVGQYLMEAPLLLEFLRRLHREYTDPKYGDDCFAWYDGFAEGWFRPELDHASSIFQWCSVERMEVVEADGNKRFRRTDTGELPCIWHNSGGSASQINFKDDMMAPWAKKLELI